MAVPSWVRERHGEDCEKIEHPEATLLWGVWCDVSYLQAKCGEQVAPLIVGRDMIPKTEVSTRRETDHTRCKVLVRRGTTPI